MPGSPFFPVQPLNSLSTARQRCRSESMTALSAPTAPQHGSAQNKKRGAAAEAYSAPFLKIKFFSQTLFYV